MAGRDLRALFSTNDRGLEAVEAFTNRQLQWELVAAALSEHLRLINESAFDVEDLERPRHNVMVFHGVGESARRPCPASWRPRSPGPISGLPSGVSPPGPDSGSCLYASTWLAPPERPSRTSSSRSARRWPNWAARCPPSTSPFAVTGRPSTPVNRWRSTCAAVASRAGSARRCRSRCSPLADVAQALLLPGTVGTAAGALAGSLTRALRERRQTVRALAGCARLADLLEADPDLDALSFYPHLLAWELAQLPADKRVMPVILLDTFEDVGDRTHRDLERLIQRIVWLMPNCFFVITGRSRLQWADAALQGQLDYTGPAAWPHLALPQPSRRPAPPGRPTATRGRSSSATSPRGL